MPIQLPFKRLPACMMVALVDLKVCTWEQALAIYVMLEGLEDGLE